MPLMLALLLVLSSCGRSPEPREADLIFVSIEHKFLDPQRMTWLHDIRIGECLFEPLLRFRLTDMTVEGATAERWEVSKDGLTYTFHLRPAAQWSNGDPVTAQDFAFAWRRALLQEFACDYSQFFFRIKGARDFFDWRTEQLARFNQPGTDKPDAAKLWEQTQKKFKETVGIATPDDLTLVVTLEKPCPYFIELCAFTTFVPNHRASLEKEIKLNDSTGLLEMDDTYWTDPKRLIGNGPYVLVRRNFKIDLLLHQNPCYWNKAGMGNTSILEKVSEDPQSAMMIYNNGEADWLPDMPTASALAADLVAQKRSDVHLVPSVATYFYNFNCSQTLPDGRKNPLSDPRVRRALSMGIDRDTIVRQVTRLNQPTAVTFTPPGTLPGYQSPVESGTHYDIEAAKKLLAEAGYPGGKGLTGISILFNTGQGHETVAQFIKRTWEEKLGVVVTLEPMEQNNFADRLKKHEFTISRASWFADYRDPTTFLDKFQTGNGNNDPGYQNLGYDERLQQAESETDPARRMAILRDAESLLMSEQPIAPIYHYVNLHVFNADKVKNMNLNAWNFRRLELVKVEK